MKYACTLCLLLLVSFVPVFLKGAETLQYVPDSCFSVVTVSNVQSDRGVNWLIDAWINSPRESPLYLKVQKQIIFDTILLSR